MLQFYPRLVFAFSKHSLALAPRSLKLLRLWRLLDSTIPLRVYAYYTGSAQAQVPLSSIKPSAALPVEAQDAARRGLQGGRGSTMVMESFLPHPCLVFQPL